MRGDFLSLFSKVFSEKANKMSSFLFSPAFATTILKASSASSNRTLPGHFYLWKEVAKRSQECQIGVLIGNTTQE